jgi:hypothetical protein
MSPARAKGGRSLHSATTPNLNPITRYFPVIHNPTYTPQENINQQSVINELSRSTCTTSNIQLTPPTIHHLTLDHFTGVTSTPLGYLPQQDTPGAPQRQLIFISPNETILPCRLFREPPCAPISHHSAIQPTTLVLRKITSYFTAPVSQRAPEPTIPSIPTITITLSPNSRSASISQVVAA